MKLIALALFATLINSELMAQTVCPGQSQQEQEWQKNCPRDTCFKGGNIGGGLCEPSKASTVVLTADSKALSLNFPIDEKEDEIIKRISDSDALLEIFEEKNNNKNMASTANCKRPKPRMPDDAEFYGISDTVVAEITMNDGITESAKILSGDPIFHKSVLSALKKYECPNMKGKLVLTQEFNFLLQISADELERTRPLRERLFADRITRAERERWLQTAEGKKYLVEESVRQRNAETARLNAESAERQKQEMAATVAKAQSEKNKNECLKVRNWGADSREIIAAALKVPMASVAFIRAEINEGNPMLSSCVIVADTAKGPTKCNIFAIRQISKTKEYWADLCHPLGCAQAVCR